LFVWFVENVYYEERGDGIMGDERMISRLKEVVSDISGVEVGTDECIKLVDATHRLNPLTGDMRLTDVCWFGPSTPDRIFYSLYYIPTEEAMPGWLSGHKPNGRLTVPAVIAHEAAQQAGLLCEFVMRAYTTHESDSQENSVNRVLETLLHSSTTDGFFARGGGFVQRQPAYPGDVLITTVRKNKVKMGILHVFGYKSYINTMNMKPAIYGTFTGKEVIHGVD